MDSNKQTGRLIGALLLASMLAGLWNNFGLTNTITAGTGWLHNGSQMPSLFAVSALLALVTSAVTLAVGVMAWPILRQHTPSLALAFVLLTAIGFATTAMEQANFLSLRSLSLQFAKHPGIDPALFDILRSMTAGNRNWIHYIDKIIGGGSLLVLYVALFRSHLVPRIIPVVGMLAAPIQMCGISLELFLIDLPQLMLAPLALTQLVLCLTLLSRGFSQPMAAPVTVATT
jgi:hypothetical protein